MTEIVIGYPRVVRELNADLFAAATPKAATVTPLPTVGDLLNYKVTFAEDLTPEEHQLALVVAAGNERSDAMVHKTRDHWLARPQWNRTAKALRMSAAKVKGDRAGTVRERELADTVETLTEQVDALSAELHKLQDFVLGMFTGEFSDTGPQETSIADVFRGTGVVFTGSLEAQGGPHVH